MRQDEVPKVIPVTPLRKLYEWLRFDIRHLGRFGTYAVHQAIAKAYCDRPHTLNALFRESVVAFQRYDNRGEAFRPKTRSDRFDTSTSNGTVRVVQAIRKQGGVLDLGGHQFYFVDREVGTLRSTPETGPWKFEDGRPSRNPGAGGIDLLMHDKCDKSKSCLPIIGEIKVKHDGTPFFALIQALTYAVELATSCQQQRLKTTYGNCFDKLAESPRVGILLLMVNAPQEDAAKAIRKTISELVAALYKKGCALHRTIAHITLVDAQQDNKGKRVSKNNF